MPAISTDIVEAAAARVEGGSTVAAEARRLHLDYKLLRNALLKASRRTRRPRGTAPVVLRLTPRAREAIRLHLRGLSTRNIARRLGMSRSGVHLAVRTWKRASERARPGDWPGASRFQPRQEDRTMTTFLAVGPHCWGKPPHQHPAHHPLAS